MATRPRQSSPQRRFTVESLLLLLLATVFSLSANHLGWFGVFDRAFYDAIISRIAAPTDEDVVIAAVDDTTIHEFGPWPWPRELQANLVSRLNAFEPKLIVLDILHSGTAAGNPALVAAAADVPKLALPMMVENSQFGGQVVEVLPFPELLQVADALGHVHVELDPDAIVRGTYLFQGVGEAYWPHLMASASGTDLTSDCSTVVSRELVKCHYKRVPFAGPAGTYPYISAGLLLNPQVNGLEDRLRTAIQGKVVLVGITATGVGDWITSPTSQRGGPLPGVEFNANLYSALTQNTLIDTASMLATNLLTLLFVALATMMLPRLPPKPMLWLTLGLASLPFLVSFLALIWFAVYLPLATVTVTVALVYPIWSWRRHEIAWGFIDRELARIDSEQTDWRQHQGHLQLEVTQSDRAEYLAELLRTEVSFDGSTYERTDNRPNQLLMWVNDTQNDNKKPKVRSPGEILAAQINRLERRAAEVRQGRALGLDGLGRMPNGVAIFSATGDIRLINEAASELLDIKTSPPTSVIELLRRLTPPLGKSWFEILNQVILDKTPIVFESQVTGQRPVFVAAEPLGDGPDFAENWVLTLSDLTTIRGAQAQREEALAFLSHDIRSPLTSVLALIKNSREESDLLQDIARYTQKGLSTSEQFLQLSRLQLQTEFETYDIDAEQVINNAVEQVFFQAREKGIKLVQKIEVDEEDVWISANGELLERALINLLTNAVKYSPADTTVTVELDKPDNRLLTISVEDQGYGIPEDEQDLIFEPYFRSNQQILAEHRGAGLGLRFVKTVVDRHRGSIHLSSTWGKGTRFEISLPR